MVNTFKALQAPTRSALQRVRLRVCVGYLKRGAAGHVDGAVHADRSATKWTFSAVPRRPGLQRGAQTIVAELVATERPARLHIVFETHGALGHARGSLRHSRWFRTSLDEMKYVQNGTRYLIYGYFYHSNQTN